MKSKQPKQTIESKIKEYNKLLVSQDNPERLKELKNGRQTKRDFLL